MSAAGRWIRLAADLHVLGLRTASEAVNRNLSTLAAAIVRELRAGGHEALVVDVLRWEADVAGRRAVMTRHTAAEERTEARRLETEARRAEDEGRDSDAERLWARARMAWRTAGAVALGEIGGVR